MKTVKRTAGQLAAALCALLATNSVALGYEEMSIDPATFAAENNLAAERSVRLVLGDAEKAEQGVFLIANPSSELVLVDLEAYNSDGTLLGNESLRIERSSLLIVSWPELWPDTASVRLTMDSGYDERLTVSVPRESSIVNVDAAHRAGPRTAFYTLSEPMPSSLNFTNPETPYST